MTESKTIYSPPLVEQGEPPNGRVFQYPADAKATGTALPVATQGNIRAVE